MANKYYSVEIPVDLNGDIHRRLQALAERSGSSFEAELVWAVIHGINHHIRDNLASAERMYGMDK